MYKNNLLNLNYVYLFYFSKLKHKITNDEEKYEEFNYLILISLIMKF